MSIVTTGGNRTGVSADLLRPPRRWTNALLLFIVVTVVAIIGWAWWAELDEVTSGNGQVIPASKIKVVQNLEGGIVSEILTKDGASAFAKNLGTLKAGGRRKVVNGCRKRVIA